jgi:hypothetical protein
MMKSASDQLRDDIDRSDARSHWAAWIVVVGLVVEAVLALHFPAGKTAVENWAPVVADMMIALGVYGEIHYSGKAARHKSDCSPLAMRSSPRL